VKASLWMMPSVENTPVLYSFDSPLASSSWADNEKEKKSLFSPLCE